MKDTMSIFIFSLMILFALSPTAGAITIDGSITVFDGMSDRSAWHGTGEDQEVEPLCEGAQRWDLEGFYLNETKLSMVGGYDFVNGGYDYYRNRTYSSGDIFIDITGNANNPANIDTRGIQNDIIKNTFGYDYVLDINFRLNTYDVIRLGSNSQTRIAYFDENSESNPWRYYGEANGYAVDYVLRNQTLTYGTYSEVNDLIGASHNVSTFDLSFLNGIDGFNGDFTAHFTMECGNDNLMGEGHINPAPVPEPATMMLLGSGLLGLAGFRRKVK